jgi:hypothetical protein
MCFKPKTAGSSAPRRCFRVNEAQTQAIATCIRETFRSIKPFVFIAAVLIPLALIGGTVWLALHGGTLNVVESHVGGSSSTYSQMIGQSGSTGTLTVVQFRSGQTVRLSHNLPYKSAAGGEYKVIRSFPEIGGELRYRVKSEREPHERVIGEADLEKA